MATREELRRGLYEKLKDIINIPIKDRGNVKLQDLGGDKGYKVFKGLYFQSIEQYKDFPNSGTKNLFKIYKATYDDTKYDEKTFIQIYACDLKYAKGTEYCRVEPRDSNQYYGSYQNEKLGKGVVKETTDLSGGGISLLKMMAFEINIKGTNFTFQLKPTGKKDVFDAINFNILDPTSTQNVGTITFHDTYVDPDTNTVTPYLNTDDTQTVGAFTFDVKNGLGTTLIANKYRFEFLNDQGESEDEEIVVTTDSSDETDPVKPDPVKPDPVKPDPKKPDPVKPKYKNYCREGSFPWILGCENKIIEFLNKEILQGRNASILTQELLDYLDNMKLIPSDKNSIMMDDYNKRIKVAFPQVKNLEENKLIKKVIKESVRRNLRDIYNRS
jgi:hypothetical protein